MEGAIAGWFAFIAFSNDAKILVNGLGLQEDFGGAAPDHHQPVELVFLLELADVVAHLLGKIEFRFALLDVRAREDS